MTWAASGWYLNTLQAHLAGTAQTGTPNPLNWLSSAQQKCSLVSSTPVNYAAPLTYGAGTAPWVATNEVTGTGWVTGGVLLSTAATGADVTPSSVISGAGPYVLTYSWGAGLSVAGTTLTAVYGMIIYYPNATAPVSKPMLLAISFGASYATVAGVFGVTPSGSGLSALTLTA